jgi:hypothetical protein
MKDILHRTPVWAVTLVVEHAGVAGGRGQRRAASLEPLWEVVWSGELSHLWRVQKACHRDQTAPLWDFHPCPFLP